MIQQLARQYLSPDKAIRISVVPSAQAADSSTLARKEWSADASHAARPHGWRAAPGNAGI
jgi:hypothetical protein